MSLLLPTAKRRRPATRCSLRAWHRRYRAESIGFGLAALVGAQKCAAAIEDGVVVTLFPEYFKVPLAQSMTGRARRKGLLSWEIVDLRDYAGKSPSALARIRGRIIGEGGKARRTIEELTGAYISVYGHMVGFIGSFKEVKLATDAIVMLAKGSMHKSVYTMLQDAKRRDKMDRMRLWEDSDEEAKPSES